MSRPWRLAPALVQLRDQINAAAPFRRKISDGTIGDAAHAALVSDHNPNRDGVVCAIDITHDPANGVDIARLSEQLRDSRDPRLKYLIRNGQITRPSGTGRGDLGPWSRYTGLNAHDRHIHISVLPGAYAEDASPWQLAPLPQPLEEHDDMNQDDLRAALFAARPADFVLFAQAGTTYIANPATREWWGSPDETSLKAFLDAQQRLGRKVESWGEQDAGFNPWAHFGRLIEA